MILSPTLSWLECYNPPYDSIADVIGWSIRRSLIYPYLRSYDLAKHIAEDVCEIMKRGRRTVIRCLLQLHKIMEQSESHYLFNKLYIDPLIGWIQQCEEDEVQQIGDALELLLTAKGSNSSDVLGKQHLDLDLEDIEKRFFESDEEKDTSSSEDEDSSSTVDYESDDESGGDTDVTTDEEGQTERLTKEDGKHSSALLDNNIGQEEGSLIQDLLQSSGSGPPHSTEHAPGQLEARELCQDLQLRYINGHLTSLDDIHGALSVHATLNKDGYRLVPI
eukprot:scaffold26442_cov82-Skeletonema_marinoi.AAC.1